MARVGIAIDKDWLEEQYITNKRTTPDIAKEVGCSHSYVGNVLKRYGIAVRSAKEAKSMHTNALEYLENKEWLHEQYITLRKSTPTIGKELGCSSNMVATYLTQHEIEIRSIRDANNIAAVYVEDREWLYEQYITSGKTIIAIGKEIGCTPTTVANWLRTHKIDARNPSEAKGVYSPMLNDAEWLYEQYADLKMTPKDIGELVGCSAEAVNTKLKHHGIRIRSVAEAQIRNIDALGFLLNKEWVVEQYIRKRTPIYIIANNLGCSRGTVLKYITQHGIEVYNAYRVSSHEKELQEFLATSNIEYKPSDRSMIYPLELDIFIPDKNLAVEINGVYWHSVDSNSNADGKNKHLNKLQRCIDVGITLLQFTCSEWITKQDIVKSIILTKLGETTHRIFARKCSIIEVDKADEAEFFNRNHIQGHTRSDRCIGLMYGDEYVCMISFGKPRYDKTHETEIIRIATKLNCIVVGGVSKMFKYFLGSTECSSIITYADRQYSTGNIYTQLGFVFSHHSAIGYKWVLNGVTYNRWQFMKHKLKDKLKIFDDSLSESENMFNNGYRKLYDCGQSVYSMRIGGI